MKNLGKYDNENFVMVDLSNTEDDKTISVEVHETIHMLLSQQTKWGLAEYYFNHIGRLIDSRYLYLAEFIHKNCELVQESLALFCEKLSFAMKFGEDKLIKDIKEERWKNPKNCRYLKEVLNIIENKGDIPLNDVVFSLYRIAIHSMNIDFMDIPAENWNNNKIEKIFENRDVPNVVYERMLKEFAVELQTGNLGRYLESIENEWSRPDLEGRQKLVRTLIMYIKKICIQSEYYKQIEDYLSTIRCKLIDIDRVADYVIPKHYFSYEVTNAFWGADAQFTILFISGNSSDIRYTFKNKNLREDRLIRFDRVGNKILIFYLNYLTKSRYDNIVSESQLQKIIKKTKRNLVINYKAYENNNKLKKILEYSRKRYYVYCDRPYYSARETIEMNCIDKKWNMVKFGNFYTLCFKIGQYGILFTIIFDEFSFIQDLEMYFTGRKIFMEDMFENAEDLREFILIINGLLGE